MRIKVIVLKRIGGSEPPPYNITYDKDKTLSLKLRVISLLEI